MKCGELKPLRHFYEHPRMKDGRLNKCKECTCRDVRANRRKRIEYYREYDLARANDPDRVEARKRYQQSPEGKIAHARGRRGWLRRNPEKRQAEMTLGNAVRDGRIEKPESCEACGAGGRIHGHHFDYSKPLDVQWLCPPCHSFVHKVERAADKLFGEYT